MLHWHIAVLGKGDAHTRARMDELLGPDADEALWYTHGEEPAMRNAALDFAFRAGKGCLQIHTDVLGFTYLLSDREIEMTFMQAANMLTAFLEGDPHARVAGIPNSSYGRHLREHAGTTRHLAFRGPLVAIQENPLRFDEALLDAHVLDYCLRQFDQYQAVLRVNRIFARYVGPRRMPPAAQQSFEYHAMHARWPGRLIEREDMGVQAKPLRVPTAA